MTTTTTEHCLLHDPTFGTSYLLLYRVVQKTDPQFFGITSVIQHRFWPFFHCYKQKFMARKREVFPPTAPLLCDHIT